MKELLIALAVVGLFIAIAIGFVRSARADTPISKCWTHICAEPQLSLSVVQYDLSSRKVSAGLLPVGSIGYGVRDVNDYLAVGLFLSASVGGDDRYIAPAILVRVMRAGTVGVQARLGEDTTRWSLLLGGGIGL